MTLEEIKQTAFAKWLLLQPEEKAVDHIWECLRLGGQESMAWSLWEAVHGEAAFKSDEVWGALADMLKALKE